MPWRVVIECAKDFIPQGFIKRPGLIAECIEVRCGAAALFGGALHGGDQLLTVASAAQGLRDPTSPICTQFQLTWPHTPPTIVPLSSRRNTPRGWKPGRSV